MKKVTAAVLIILIFCFAQCKKDLFGLDNNGLPPVTQTGANTFGFLLNGQPWIPQGNNGSGNNLSIDYDPGFNNGLFAIAAYRALGTGNSDDFGIGAWNLNFLNAPFKIDLKNNTTSRARLFTTANCWLTSRDSGVLKEGSFYIDKLDKQNRIIAGRFNFTLHKNGCDTIKVTEGRFDMKF